MLNGLNWVLKWMNGLIGYGIKWLEHLERINLMELTLEDKSQIVIDQIFTELEINSINNLAIEHDYYISHCGMGYKIIKKEMGFSVINTDNDKNIHVRRFFWSNKTNKWIRNYIKKQLREENVK